MSYNSEEVRELLRTEAKKLGSQKALAEAAGVSNTFVSDIIRGKREP